LTFHKLHVHYNTGQQNAASLFASLTRNHSGCDMKLYRCSVVNA